MNERKKWEDALIKSPFVDPRFTEQLREQIIYKVNHKQKKRNYTARIGALTAIVITIVCVLFAADITNLFTNHSKIDQTIRNNPIEAPRTEYWSNGSLLFQVFPDPYLVAGVQTGLIIHFKQPFDIFSGKELTIVGHHPQSGKQLTVTSPVTITKPSSGYDSLQRFTTSFALPLGGMWKFEIKLNEQIYGDFVLEVPEPAPWTSTSTFEIAFTGQDGLPYNYVLAGEKGKAGFIVGSNQQPFIVGKANKYMWHFWGSKDELTGSFNVKAVKEGTTREIDIFSARGLAGALNGADASTPSMMGLPEVGIWRLNAYINNKLFSSIYVRAVLEN